MGTVCSKSCSQNSEPDSRQVRQLWNFEDEKLIVIIHHTSDH
jgi:hypothetical protein